MSSIIQSWFTCTLFLILLVPSLGLNSDGTLLLSFKYAILSDPLSLLDNWNYYDATPCFWTGVTCAEMGAPFGSMDRFRVIGLVLPNAKLLGSIPEDVGFIEHLRTLDLSNNVLNGTLPTSFFNASELHVLSLSSNEISGELPELIGGLKSLQFLNLSDNALAGKIPENLTSLQNLSVVSLRNNYFSGGIPRWFQSVEVLDLSSNLFNGSLPLEFSGPRLRYLNLSSNKLSGPVSPEFAKKLPPNATIDLSFNNLTGQIPESVALSNQKAESFAGNIDLCGKPLKKLCAIPSTLSAPPNVSTNNSTPAIAAIPKTLDTTPLPNSPGATKATPQTTQLKHGMKPGTVAAIAVGDLAGIGVLAIIFLYVYQAKKKKSLATEEKHSTTKDSGSKEDNLRMSKDTRSINNNCSCLNTANGEETSEATTSEEDQEKGHNINEGDVDYNNDQKGNDKNKKERLLVMVDGETELELETLLRASAYILGSSGSSIVYKAVLEDGTAFAVRRIGECGVERLKDFESQVRAIAKLRHPNLVRVRGFYWGDDEKLVIYDYVSNGSLAGAVYSMLSGKIGSSPYNLPLQVRLKIAKGLARGLNYLHDKKHVHGNIKPNNILLTSDMEPIISDFGLDWLTSGKQGSKNDGSARHFGSKRSTSGDGAQDFTSTGNGTFTGVGATSSPHVGAAGFVGCTSPYHAPESLKSLKPSPKWDVYSFGIVLLELLTGKVFSDRELSQWTGGSSAEEKNRVLRMADVAIRADVEASEDALFACFRLGFSCASLVPQKRPSMKDAVQVLDKIQCSSH